MKKICLLLGISAFLIIGFFLFTKEDKEEIFDTMGYILSDNSNDVFNETFSVNSNMQFSVLTDSPAIPLENYQELTNLSEVNDILPCYPLDIVTKENGNNTWYYWQDQDQPKKTISMPIKTPYDSYMNLITLKSVVNYDHFYQSLESGAVGNRIIHEFNSDSGIYISSSIFNQLDLDENLDQLFIQIDVRVPVVATIEQRREEGTLNFEYERYTPIKYEDVSYTFEVQGVINGRNGGFCAENNIIIPYEVSKEIHESVNRSDITLEDHQMYWEPNTYILICDKDLTVDQLIQSLSSKIESFYLNEYDYDDYVNYPYSYLYLDVDILKFNR